MNASEDHLQPTNLTNLASFLHTTGTGNNFAQSSPDLSSILILRYSSEPKFTRVFWNFSNRIKGRRKKWGEKLIFFVDFLEDHDEPDAETVICPVCGFATPVCGI